MVNCRTREIGVRPPLGADPSRISRLMVREGMGVAGKGGAVGVGGAVATARGGERERGGGRAREHDGPTVVVTHHAPSPRSVHARFAGSKPITLALAGSSSGISTMSIPGRSALDALL